MNSDECLLTRMQEMSLDYHFTVEQEVGSATHAFFGFNGKPSFNKYHLWSNLNYHPCCPFFFGVKNIYLDLSLSINWLTCAKCWFRAANWWGLIGKYIHIVGM